MLACVDKMLACAQKMLTYAHKMLTFCTKCWLKDIMCIHNANLCAQNACAHKMLSHAYTMLTCVHKILTYPYTMLNFCTERRKKAILVKHSANMCALNVYLCAENAIQNADKILMCGHKRYAQNINLCTSNVHTKILIKC